MACSDGSLKHDNGLSQTTEQLQNFGALNPKKQLKTWNFCSFVGLDIAERKMAPFRIKNGARLSQRLSYHKSIPPPLLFVVVGC
jgi:hypothetical protein